MIEELCGRWIEVEPRSFGKSDTSYTSGLPHTWIVGPEMYLSEVELAKEIIKSYELAE